MTEPINADLEKLAHDLMSRVAVYAPGWTDSNSHDPGITILELFAFLTESLLARSDATPQVAGRAREIAQQVERTAALRCTDATLTRPRYFFGKLIGVDDFNQEQEYLRTKQRRHNRLLHGVGIVSGLGVSLGTEDGEPVIVVSPGLAIGPTGEELLVCERVTVRLRADEGARHVTVGLVERPVDPVPALVGPDDAASDTEASRIEESADVVVVENVPPVRLVIARLVRSGDSVQIDPSFVSARVRR